MDEIQIKPDSVQVENKLSSRKFWISQQIIGLCVVVPVVFQKLGVGESVTLMVLGVIGGAGAAYGVVNVLDKKWS